MLVLLPPPSLAFPGSIPLRMHDPCWKKTNKEKAGLRHQLDRAAGVLDLLLGLLADPPGADHHWDLGQAALAEQLGVAERQEVDLGDLVGAAAGLGVLGLLLGGDEGPQL